MNKLGSILSIPDVLLVHMSGFLKDHEHICLSRCCRRTQSIMEEACKGYCLHQSPYFSDLLQKNNARVHSWCIVRHQLIGKPVVYSEQPYSSHLHGGEGRRNEGLTNERRTWTVSRIWTASGREGTLDDLRAHDAYYVCQRQEDGVTCYKIPHRVDACYHGLQTEAGKTTVSSTLIHRQWVPIKLTTLPTRSLS